MRFIHFIGAWIIALIAFAKADLAIERSEESSGVKYELILKEADERRVIWEARPSDSSAPLFEGGPTIREWYNLIAADQTKDGILVLIERNEFTIELLQFDGGGVFCSIYRRRIQVG